MTSPRIPHLTLSGHRDAVWKCAFSPDATRIASASRDHTVRLWDALSGAALNTLTGHRNWVRTCAFSPDGTQVVSGSRDRTLRVWDTATGAELACLQGHTDEVRHTGFCLDGARIVSASSDGSLRLWDADTWAPVATFGHHLEPVQVLLVSPDGRHVVAGRHHWATVWDVERGTEVASLGHPSLVRACAISPDGQWVASGSGHGVLKVWDAGSGKDVRTLSGHESYVAACAFSPGGDRLISASGDRSLRLWDPGTGKCLAVLTGHDGEVVACRFAPDGGFIVSASRDRTLRLWDAATGAAQGTLAGHQDEIRSMDLSPDGGRIVSGSFDRTLRLWLLESLRQRAHPAPRDRSAGASPSRLFAFISYRRESGADTARLIRAELQARGFRTFLDVEDLGAYHFDESLLRRIEEAPHFIVILSPGALERCAQDEDWLGREIAHAIATDRNIVPVLKEGFRFPPPESLPPSIAELPRYNSVEYSHVYFGATMSRLLAFCGSDAAQ